MKVKETRITGGLNGGAVESRVVEVEGEEVPAGSVRVDDSTPVSDWAREEE